MPVQGISDDELCREKAWYVFEQRFDTGAMFDATAVVAVDMVPCDKPFLAAIFEGGREPMRAKMERHPNKQAAIRGLSSLVMEQYGVRRAFGR